MIRPWALVALFACAFTCDIPGSVDAASVTPSGGITSAERTKLAGLLRPKRGTALANASATIQPGTDHATEYVSSTTQTANRTTTLGTTSMVTGAVLRIVRTDTAAYTRAIVNGGTSGGTLFTFPASPAEAQAATFYWGGADWSLVAYEYLVQ